jgi:hypothetical protein
MLAYAGRGRYVIGSIDLGDLIRVVSLSCGIHPKASSGWTWRRTARPLKPISASYIVMNLVIDAQKARNAFQPPAECCASASRAFPARKLDEQQGVPHMVLILIYRLMSGRFMITPATTAAKISTPRSFESCKATSTLSL